MKEIVVLGAGYAGLKTVVLLQKKLKDSIHITLVDQNDYHYEATDLHEVAAGTQGVSRISYHIRDVIKPRITTFIQAKVVKIDPEQRAVKLAGHDDLLHYDYCVIGLGFVSETFGVPGAEENAFPMTNLKEASAIYNHIISKMRDYRKTQNPDDLHIIICGGGFTGIELAGALVEARPSYAKIAGVTPDKIKITLVEAATRLLPMFNEKLADYGVDLIKESNVQLLDGSRISKIDPGTVYYKHADESQDQSMDAGTIIWTTGVSGSPLMKESGFDEKRGRVMVTPHLTAPKHDDVYILGDVAAVMPPDGKRPYPTTAQIALAMADYAADDIATRIKTGKHEEKAFVYKSLGTVASYGNTKAYGTALGHELRGYPASVMKKIIADRSLMETGGLKELLAKGRFDLYH
ncbi:NAD(P)/FAD-dependent oxidoreductase [Limosilactobacillus sp. STM2_1]|uniref:NAD(P)/FAD-dependent oxidoreductase n=1 Tax=Limosilactobacillus rudii TaxID=2759755 RepID=A0A7W3YNR3_9LACO|nr:NAD(P)/FAD-dependent oxidoreductase [Limosilactobacillus rudii]MBB1079887.1 NAD(P)/FAD-dependent oxidoreductase [Limosilactobacillus rudii]MBB1097965.1 NAD(P)/FAD-dependent oxidoreductase [Limosilactobacillus rudii]MCD7135034.1 NAD(P)/FAD-dependent oxidoreductase [Limosilactobacillus rudii]